MVKQTIVSASAAELHAMPMPTAGANAELWVMHPTRPALVMGSSQRPEQFDIERLDVDRVELAERRSGGGAVFINPASTVWIDVLAPRSSSLWSNDLTENFLIVGRVWQQAFVSLGLKLDLCVNAPTRTDAAGLACWAGIGWGELTLTSEDRVSKVVGLSQRRTRWGSRVQAMAVLDTSSARVSDYLHVDDRRLVHDTIATDHVGVVTDAGITSHVLEAAVLATFAG